MEKRVGKRAQELSSTSDQSPSTAHGKEGVDSGSSLPAQVAHNWRAVDLQGLTLESRLPKPALIEAIKGERRAPAQPVFDVCDCYELQSTTPNTPQLRSNVVIEEVPTTSERLRGLRSASEPGVMGGEHFLAFASAPPIWRRVTGSSLSRAREYQIVPTAASRAAPFQTSQGIDHLLRSRVVARPQRCARHTSK